MVGHVVYTSTEPHTNAPEFMYASLGVYYINTHRA